MVGDAEMMEKAQITLKDIASEAGCSVASVSTVLNSSKGNTKVSEAMRQRILGIAQRANYRPNFASRSLKRSSARTLGLYVQPGAWHGIGYSYEHSIFLGIEKAAREASYDLLMLNMNSDAAPEICAERLAERRLDGVLLIHAEPGFKWITDLLALSGNVVAIDYCGAEKELPSVVFDNEGAVRAALDHLYGLGHRRIAFLGHCVETPPRDSLLREMAFKAARDAKLFKDAELTLFNIENCPERLDMSMEYCQREGVLGMKSLLSSSPRPTAAICYNWLAGIFAMKTALGAGLSIPEELSLTAIDDFPFAEFLSPRMTVFDHPLEEMGRAGAKMLIERIEKPGSPALRKYFAPQLVRRESTGPAPGGI